MNAKCETNRRKPLARFLCLSFTLALLHLPGVANTLPFGGTDGLCTPHVAGPSNGVTTCTVFEGQGDTLLELVLNATPQLIRVDSVAPGPIVGVAGDNTDWIVKDPVSPGGGPMGGPLGPLFPAPADCLAHPVLAPLGAPPAAFPGVPRACTFNQSFTTDTGEPGPLLDGESTMSFVLGFTPLPPTPNPVPLLGGGGGVLGPGGLGLFYAPGLNPTPLDGRGQWLVTITSADVTVSDTPEPATMLLLGAGLITLGSFRRRRSLPRLDRK